MKDPRFAAAYNWAAHRSPAAPEELQRARTLAEEVALDAPHSEAVERVLTKLAHAHQARTAFYERFAELVCEDEQRRQAWIAVLLSEVATAIDDPKALKAQFEIWKEENDPFSVWGPRHYYHITYREAGPFFPLYLLLLIDPVVWLHAMDGLPSPGMMEGALLTYTDLRQDRDRIEALIPLAPPVFDAQGRWLPSRSVAALLFTEQIVVHAAQLRQAVSSQVRLARARKTADQAALEEQLAKLETEELPTWMRRAFDLVLTRPDGQHIALGFLEHLARKMLVGGRYVAGENWSAEELAFRALAQALASAGVGVAEARKSWLNAVAVEQQKQTSASAAGLTQPTGEPKISAREGEGAQHLVGNGLPLLVGAAVMLGDDPKSLEEIRQFWHWFEELLIGRDPGLSYANYDATRVDLWWRRFGVLLSRLDEPALRFRQLYIALEPQRRRAQFRYRYDDHDSDLGSILLLRVGLFAALNCFEHAQAPHEKEVAREWFWWFYEAARRLWLVAVHDYEHEKRNLIPLCFAFIPFLFGDELDDAVQRAMTPIANNAHMISSSGWSLWKNGVALDRLLPLLRHAGADIETALRDAYQWAKLTDPGPMPYGQENPEWPTTLAELADALGLKLDADPVAQDPSHKPAYRRDEFARSIPWGAVLLRRLEDDGCVRVRCRPLEATGSTWLLQAELASTVSEKFGFSPEIRVLAVHGQVRGRDMRTAVQHPEDASQVDPDLLVIASDQPDLARRLPALAGPWGQRIPWPFVDGRFEPLQDTLREHLPGFDLFDYRDPVKGSALIGRCDHIDDLVSRVLRGHAVGVFGLRKVGKSSLLRAVADRIDPIGARRGMFASLTVPLPDAEPEALVVSLDVQGVAGRGLDVLLERLIAVLEDRLALATIPMRAPAGPSDVVVQVAMPVQGRPANDDNESMTEIRNGHDIPARDPMDRLRGLLAIALERTSLPVCFIFDEYDLLFEGYSGEPGIPGVEQLFAFLRAEAQATQRVSLVTIGRDPGFIDRPLLGGRTNPLAGWVQYLWLGPLKREEADELLVRLGKRVALDVGAATRETAWQWTGGHPLLLRQYGAALFELAHAPPTRPRPVPTDPIHEDAVELFLLRDAVYTITGEVRALLDARFSDALALVEELSNASVAEAEAIVKRHGGRLSRALNVLTRFGIVAEDQAGLWVPGVFRDEFALPVPNAERSTAGGA